MHVRGPDKFAVKQRLCLVMEIIGKNSASGDFGVPIGSDTAAAHTTIIGGKVNDGLSAHGSCRQLDGLNNFLIAGAAANMAFDRLADLLDGGIWIMI